MKLSIITVNFNNRNGLLRTARSIVGQSFSGFEWLVIDGGSTDGSQEIMSQFSAHIGWSVSEPDGGIYDAMNKGLAKASGEYVQFLNSGDSFIGRDVLEKVFSDEHLADICYGDQWCVLGDSIIEKRSYPQAMDLRYLFRAPLGHQASFIRTTLAKEHPYRVKYSISADRAFFIELYLSGASFYYLNRPIVYFDTEGIGSNLNTIGQRRVQLQQIKRDLLPAPAVKDFEKLMADADEFDFVMRVAPLRWVYSFFKWLQKVKNCR